MSELIQAIEIKEQELFRKTEIFKEKKVPRKRPQRIGDNGLIRVKPHRLNIIRNQ